MKHKLDYETPETRAVALAPECAVLQASLTVTKEGYDSFDSDQWEGLL